MKKMPEPSPEDTKYWQGVMDGIAVATDDDRDKRERARLKIAALQHVHYSSIIGPYCVICHINVPPPYSPFWSKP